MNYFQIGYSMNNIFNIQELIFIECILHTQREREREQNIDGHLNLGIDYLIKLELCYE